MTPRKDRQNQPPTESEEGKFEGGGRTPGGGNIRVVGRGNLALVVEHALPFAELTLAILIEVDDSGND